MLLQLLLAVENQTSKLLFTIRRLKILALLGSLVVRRRRKGKEEDEDRWREDDKTVVDVVAFILWQLWNDGDGQKLFKNVSNLQPLSCVSLQEDTFSRSSQEGYPEDDEMCKRTARMRWLCLSGHEWLAVFKLDVHSPAQPLIVAPLLLLLH